MKKWPKRIQYSELIQVLFGCFVMLLTVSAVGANDPLPPPPGIVIDQSPDPSSIFLGSPSIAFLPNGTYVASHDWFGPGSSKKMITVFFQSKDQGKSWKKISELKNHYWSKLFYCNNALWSVGWAPKVPGIKTASIAIRRSDDGGRTWTEPKDGKSGLLLADRQYCCEPNPILFHNGKIWTVFEARGPATGKDKRNWATGFCPLVASAPIGADLLDRSVWTFSNSVSWTHQPGLAGWLEGNVLVDPLGKILVLLRVDDVKNCGKAARINVSDDGKKISFDPQTGFVSMPGGCKKFMIRYDEKSKKYWALTNWVHPADKDHPDKERVRNTLALAASDDLKKWEIRTIVLRHENTNRGFQYVDWRFEGEDDLVFVSRTAWEGARNCHDANFLTFHRLKNFRDLTRMNDDLPYPVLNPEPETYKINQPIPYKIGTNFPGGYANIESVRDNTVLFNVNPEEPLYKHLAYYKRIRNHVNFPHSYHWAFRVEKAQGQTLHFKITRGCMLSWRGPAISRDGGLSWKWLGDPASFLHRRNEFTYTFGPEEKDVLFAQTPLYTQRDLERFLKTDTAGLIKREVLCQSPHGRPVERLRLGNPNAKYGVVLTARHHPPETEASFALEGVMKELLSDSPEAQYLRQNVDFFIVPFMAKDDVEEGGDHTRTMPHNYNRDYTDKLFPEVRAITDQIPQWSAGKKFVSHDFHTPGPYGWYTFFITKEDKDPHFAKAGVYYQSVCQRQKKKGEIPVDMERIITGYLPNEMSRFCAWTAQQPNCLFATCIEICTAQAADWQEPDGGKIDWYIFPRQVQYGTEVTPENLRSLGRNMAKGLAEYFKSLK